MREPAVAGRFYEKSQDKLIEQVKGCYQEAFGETLPEPAPERIGNILGVVSPHAGYYFSGTTAARGYGEVALDGLPSTFIILGPLHSIGNAVALGGEDYSTPMGDVPIDRELMEALWVPPIDKLNSTHRYEHSIEVQLPFIQFFKHPFRMVPIAMGRHDLKTAQRVGELVAMAVKETGQGDDIVIVASSDFSHMGASYGNIPVPNPTAQDLLDWMDKYDGMAIKKIEEMDPAGLLKVRDRFHVTVCGAAPIAAMLTATKILGATHAEKLVYTSSYARSHSADGIVGYASIVVKK